MRRAEAAYERMFAGKSQEELVTLTQRESMAVLIGKELAAFLLEEHVALNPAAKPAQASTACCPKCGASAGDARSAGSFFPLDVRLGLGTEGFSPSVLAKAVRQASKASSFAEAGGDLRELAEIEISPTHLQRLSERIGREWAEA